MAHVNPFLDQVGFKGYVDDGAEGAATDAAAENTGWTQEVDTNFRIRFAIDETAGGSENNVVLQLQYNLNGGGWNNVDGTSSAVARSFASSFITDEGATTNQLTSGSGTFLTGAFDEGDGLAGSNNQIDFAGSDFTEVEYCLQLRKADLTDSDTIQFRVIRSGGTLDNWTQTPTITANVPAAVQTVTPTAISSNTTLGTPTVAAGALTISVSGTASTATVGNPSISNVSYVQPSAVTPTTNFGATTLLSGPITRQVSGVASTVTVGAVSVNSEATPVYPNSITSTTAHGTSSLSLKIYGGAFSSSTAVGSPSLNPGALTLFLSSTTSDSQTGTPSLNLSGVTLSPASVASTTSLGTAKVANTVTVQPPSIAPTTAIGSPELTPGPITANIGETNKTLVVGTPSVSRDSLIAEVDSATSQLIVGELSITSQVTAAITSKLSNLALGDPSLNPGTVIITAAAITPSTSVPVPAVDTGTYVTSLNSVVSGLNIGSASISVGNVNATPISVSSTASVGSPLLSSEGGSTTIVATSVLSSETVNEPTLTTGPITSSVSSTSSSTLLGSATIVTEAWNIHPSTITPTLQVGVASLNTSTYVYPVSRSTALLFGQAVLSQKHQLTPASIVASNSLGSASCIPRYGYMVKCPYTGLHEPIIPAGWTGRYESNGWYSLYRLSDYRLLSLKFGNYATNGTSAIYVALGNKDVLLDYISNCEYGEGAVTATQNAKTSDGEDRAILDRWPTWRITGKINGKSVSNKSTTLFPPGSQKETRVESTPIYHDADGNIVSDPAQAVYEVTNFEGPCLDGQLAGWNDTQNMEYE